MKRLVVLLVATFVLTGLPAFASAAPAASIRPTASSADSTCRARKKRVAKKPADDNKGKKKKGKDEKKPYGFEL